MSAKLPNTPIEEEASGIVRVPYEAISRPLAARGDAHTGHDYVTPGFISEQRLADLLFRRQIRRAGRGMIFAHGKMFDLVEAVHVLGPEHGHRDSYGLTDSVEPMVELVRAGASIGPKTMHLGRVSYQVIRGVLLQERAAAESSLVG